MIPISVFCRLVAFDRSTHPPKHQEAKAAVSEGAAPDSCRQEINNLLFDMKNAVSHGKKYEPPSRSDMPAFELHNAEYEASGAWHGKWFR